MLEPKDKKRLVAIGAVLLVAWVAVDIVIGASVQNIKTAEARSASDQARANQYFGGSRYDLNSSVPNSTLVGLEGIRNATLIPLRIAGILSAILLLALSPIPKNLRLWKSEAASAPSARLTVGTALSVLGLLAIGVAQIVASNSLVSVSRVRQFSAAEKQADLEARTMRNPPGHLVPPGYNPSDVSIVFGSERVEMENVTDIDIDIAPYVSGARVIGGVLLFVGLVYVMLGIQVGPPNGAQSPVADSSVEATPDKTEE